MQVNEDHIERVEEGADGRSAIYLTNGGHIIVANDPATVVERIRSEKASLLRRVLLGPEEADLNPAVQAGVTLLSQVRGR
jgi:uncharacterized protein YlzI (FlbEa/FlbD family)